MLNDVPPPSNLLTTVRLLVFQIAVLIIRGKSRYVQFAIMFYERGKAKLLNTKSA